MSQKTRRGPEEPVFGTARFRKRIALGVRSTGKRVAVASERPVHPRVGEGSARDKFRVSGTKEMVEGAGANKVSEVLSEAGCGRCGTSNFTIEAG